ncbi:hypothetical protein A3C37_02855 [Candidatus Peribacteria bacterium RIFCSPHIGHO2_02_FULL_53_20]|nr:MAG: hypothetical protein A3C37_02855 [Candidatus Peribacteria bacterium RIFCSPHIGHO2_02_FULL_53_20]OGJ66989.1 MAG: hypothetical protein A3B61_00730 [Candidatus Peribacteria bacterium RIFCSPLOWO2_01_FULL_53_10]OGJ69446.1 MAG: hypothetical protein A3G69_04020 [Candidatus Peribacteria bacterium RIFCSPLOWO2_12_FULL_53_10]
MNTSAEATNLQQELGSFFFPDCGLRHEQLLDHLKARCVRLLVINTTLLNPLCSAEVKLHRPACPHFNDARQCSDPIERALMHLTQATGISRRSDILEYRKQRKLLQGIDRAIRDTRKHLHNTRCPGTYANAALLCSQTRDQFRKDTDGQLPDMLQNVYSLKAMEQALLQLHGDIRTALEQLTQQLMEELSGLKKT